MKNAGTCRSLQRILFSLVAGVLSVSPLAAQEDLFDNVPTFGKKTKTPPIIVTSSLTSEQMNPGSEAVLAVTVTLPPGYYIYSTTDASSARAVIKVGNTVGLTAIGTEFTPDRAPKTELDETDGKSHEKYVDEITWFRRFRLNDDADPAAVEISGTLEGMYCGEGTCTLIRPAKTFHSELVQGVPRTRQPGGTKAVSATTEPKAETEPNAAAPTVAVVDPRFVKNERPTRVGGKPGPVELQFRLTPTDAKSGDTVTLSVRMTIDKEWHAYSMSMPEGQAAIPTTLMLTKPVGLKEKSAGFTVSEGPDIKPLTVEGKSLQQEVHHGEVVWAKEYIVNGDVKPGQYGVSGKFTYQTCTGANCLPPKNVAFALGELPDDALKVAEALVVDLKNRPVVEVLKPSAAAAGLPGVDQGLMAFLLAAVAAGFAALLTPCVFPMVPITVSFFLKQSEAKHYRPMSMAVLYCLGIMGTFTGLGLLMATIFGAASVNQLANNPWLNVAIAGVMIFFGLNLLGMFEIRVPYWMLTWTAGHEGKGGIIGVLFMALTFTLVSFTCTFAFCGLLLVWAAKGQYYWPILGMLAFSAAFSLPFFFLALFPSFLQKLPKSGGWMNTIKVTMGMIELGAAFKFLSVADLAWNPEPFIFDYTFTMLAWMVISLATGLYLLGVFRLPHDTPAESVSVFRFLSSMSFLMLAAFLAAGLFAPHEPGGKPWGYVKAFAPARFEGGVDDLGPYQSHKGMKFALDYEKAAKKAQELNQPLFVDFTGVNCVNCRLMEERMAQPHNRERLERFIRTQLYTDNVPGISDRDEVERLLKFNRDYQSGAFGDATLPSYAVVTPDGKFLAKFVGLEEKNGQFAEFLDEGMKRWAMLRMKGESVTNVPRNGQLEFAGLNYYLDRDKAAKAAQKLKQPLLVCIYSSSDENCARFREGVIKRSSNRTRLNSFVRAQLFVDRIPRLADSQENDQLVEKNREFELEVVQDATLPYHAIYTPEGKLLAAFPGLEGESGEFEAFLDEGLNRWQQTQQKTNAVTTASGSPARR